MSTSMNNAITSVTPDLLAMRWPSTGAAQIWLRRRNTSPSKLGVIIGMADDTGVCLQPDPNPEAKPARKAVAKVAKVKPAAKQAAKAKPAAKPAKAPRKAAAKQEEGRVSIHADLLAKLYRMAKREQGVARLECRRAKTEGRNLAWAKRLAAMAKRDGLKFKIKHDGRHPIYFVYG